MTADEINGEYEKNTGLVIIETLEEKMFEAAEFERQNVKVEF